MKALLPFFAICLISLPSLAFFAEDPKLGLEGEEVVLTWTTELPTPPARASFGIEVPEDPFREPRWRYSAREPGDSLRTRHELRRHLGWWEHPNLDAAHLAEAGGIVLARVEAWDPRQKALRYRELRLAYGRRDSLAVELPGIALGPWIDRVGPREAWLSWTLDRPAAVRVEYGSTRNRMAWRRVSVEPALKSEILLDGLSPESEFGYRIVPEGRSSGIRTWTFRTPPEPGRRPEDGSVVFAFMSDSRAGAGGGIEAVDGTNRQMIRDLLSAAETAGAEFICFGGDLIDGYVEEPAVYRRQLASWMKAAECVGPRIPIYEGMGNHEMLADFFRGETIEYTGKPPFRDRAGAESSESLFAEAVVNPVNGPRPPAGPRGKKIPPSFEENVFSFDWGPVHMVAMNNTYDVSSHPDELGGYREGAFPAEQLDWLELDLAAARAAGAAEIFVFAHEPAFPCGGHAGDAMWWDGEIPEILEIRDRFWDILQRYGVRAAMFGDEHNYSLLRVDERMGAQYSQPVWHIVSGGVGAPYYAKDTSVPWGAYINAFSPIQHFCRIEVSREGVMISALDARGRVIDERPLD